MRAGGFSLYGEFGLNDWLKFRSITAYRRDRSFTPIDFDATPVIDVDVPAIYRNHQFSQEFQLVADKGPLQGVAGLYYLNANAFDVFDVRLYAAGARILPGLTATTRGDVGTKTWAAFTDLTYNFSDQWAVSLGARYTKDRRHAQVFRANLHQGRRARTRRREWLRRRNTTWRRDLEFRRKAQGHRLHAARFGQFQA